MLKNDCLTEKAYATIVTDACGKIILMNRQASSKLKFLKIGDDVSEIIDIDYVMKITMLDNYMDIIEPKIKDFAKAIVRTCGKGSLKTLEIYLINDGIVDESLMLNDKRLFATYSEIASTTAYNSVLLKDLLDEIVDHVKNDIRFSYRKFEIDNNNYNPMLFVNFAHLSTIIVALIAVLNEIEYRNAIRLGIENIFGEHVLKMSVNVNTTNEADGEIELAKLYPIIGMRLAYITSLCKKDDIEYDIRLSTCQLTVTLIISNAVNTSGSFSCDPFATDVEAIVVRAIGSFAYANLTETKAEEQEQV